MLTSHLPLYPSISVSNSHGNTSEYMDIVTIFQKLNQKVNEPKMTFDPTSVEVICVTIPKEHYIQVPGKYVKEYGYSDPFSKKLEPKVIDPRWPLTSGLLRSHVWLYPWVIVSQVPWKYIKVCEYSDPFFKNLNQRSLTPRWPLTPHLLRSHVWFYPRIIMSKSHGDTTYGLRTEWVITLSLSEQKFRHTTIKLWKKIGEEELFIFLRMQDFAR